MRSVEIGNDTVKRLKCACAVAKQDTKDGTMIMIGKKAGKHNTTIRLTPEIAFRIWARDPRQRWSDQKRLLRYQRIDNWGNADQTIGYLCG